ncbi:hypothetical protein AAMO2058_000177700 [Amorphochlora amoebiformis]
MTTIIKRQSPKDESKQRAVKHAVRLGVGHPLGFRKPPQLTSKNLSGLLYFLNFAAGGRPRAFPKRCERHSKTMMRFRAGMSRLHLLQSRAGVAVAQVVLGVSMVIFHRGTHLKLRQMGYAPARLLANTAKKRETSSCDLNPEEAAILLARNGIFGTPSDRLPFFVQREMSKDGKTTFWAYLESESGHGINGEGESQREAEDNCTYKAWHWAKKKGLFNE